MTQAALLHEHVGSVLVLTLNRPAKHNAVDHELSALVATALDEAEADPQVGAVCLTGAGQRAFCAGGDLGSMAARGGTPPTGPASTGFAGIVSHPISKPLVAAVNGLARGGGVEIVLACDLAVASSTATFGMPEAGHGLVAGAGGLLRLPAQVPAKFASFLLLTGDVIDADTALRWGLVNEVAPPEECMERALHLAERVAALPRQAVADTRAVVRGGAAWTASPERLAENEAAMWRGIRSPEAQALTAEYAARSAAEAATTGASAPPRTTSRRG